LSISEEKEDNTKEEMEEEVISDDCPDLTGTTFDSYEKKGKCQKKKRGLNNSGGDFDKKFFSLWEKDIAAKKLDMGTTQMDEDYFYGMSLVEKLRKFNPMNKSIVKMQIDKVVHDALYVPPPSNIPQAPLVQYHDVNTGVPERVAKECARAIMTPITPLPLVGPQTLDQTSVVGPNGDQPNTFMYELDYKDL
jgi:hypothetical protein